MKKKIKWGVIGSGGIALKRTIPEGIIPAANAELEIVYDINAQINKKVAEKFGVYAAQSIDELINSNIDAVYIATPANVHCQQAIACAKAKKHILCEKPLALTVEETKKMFQACKKANVNLGTAFMMRFQSQHQAALKMLRKGQIGKPVYARAQLSGWYPPIEGAWRQDPKQSGGGALMDMGIHCINLLEMFFGEVKQVSCFINNTVHNYKSEDSAAVMLCFKNGVIAMIDSFFCIPNASSKNILELYGSSGSIIAKRTLGQGAGKMSEMTAFLENQTCDDGICIKPDNINMYKAEIEQFSHAIITKQYSLNDEDAGIRTQKIIAACYESAKTGKSVKCR
ncbi:MAG: Gfo/Idh/MocA family oxidoreductase [Phycisphaerales bacterium]